MLQFAEIEGILWVRLFQKYLENVLFFKKEILQKKPLRMIYGLFL